MIRTAAVALAILAAFDFLIFGGAYTHLVARAADWVFRQMI